MIQNIFENVALDPFFYQNAQYIVKGFSLSVNNGKKQYFIVIAELSDPHFPFTKPILNCCLLKRLLLSLSTKNLNLGLFHPTNRKNQACKYCPANRSPSLSKDPTGSFSHRFR